MCESDFSQERNYSLDISMNKKKNGWKSFFGVKFFHFEEVSKCWEYDGPNLNIVQF